MSYDIWIGPDHLFTCEQCGAQHDISEWQEDADEYNDTYNMSGLFHEYVIREEGGNEHDASKRGLKCLDGLRAAEAIPILAKAIKDIEKTRRKIGKRFDDKYNAPNGWGSVSGSLGVLKNMHADCIRHPNFVIRIS